VWCLASVALGSSAVQRCKSRGIVVFRVVGDRSRARFATPADSPRHDGTPYRGLHVRRESLGFGLRLAQAKTGAMHGVSSLCGYLSDGHGSPGIFSILVDSSVASAPQVTPLETPREF
jgi:hypothetical protein